MLEHDDLTPVERLVETIRPGCALLRAWPLEGGVSAQVTALGIEHPDGRTERLVIRRHGAIDKGHNPDIARDEFSLLVMLHQAGLAVPKPVYLDSANHIFPTPYIVVEYVDGSTEIAPAVLPDALRQMAVFLARLHALDLGQHGVQFLSHREQPVGSILQHLRHTPNADRIRAALDARGPFAPMGESVLLHGDFWPGNIMWRDGRIAAVLDWEDAAIGDPLADLAGCRLELIWKIGSGAMADFTTRYISMTSIDLTDLPFWELHVASGAAAHLSEWGLDPATEADMRLKTNAFLERAASDLACRQV
jgi:aminoglycoside phosphotransferase (APT) family kinase protein